MKIVFLSNFYNHHQEAFCQFCDKVTDHQFLFVATGKISKERRQLGWGLVQNPPFVKEYSESKEVAKECKEAVENADAVIIGSAPDLLIQERLHSGKLVLRYSERINKEKPSIIKWPYHVMLAWKRHGRFKKMYMLCASAYTAADFRRLLVFPNKTYKWGYFPETKRYGDIEKVLNEKDSTAILWTARFLDWKHPEIPVLIAKRLKAEGYRFTVNLIGTGVMEGQIRRMISEEKLEDCVHLLGAMKPEQVRAHMERSGIFLAPSDFHEGWGAVVNESMNSGCAVVASHAMGSVPFLVKHMENGVIYQNGDLDDLYGKVKFLLEHPQEQKRLGVQAYHTIVDLWNGEVAAQRLMQLVQDLETKGTCDAYEDGPCSRATVLRNHWFKG